MAEGYQLPMNPDVMSGCGAEGFLTPMQDRLPQLVNVLPRRVIPIVFLPGTMGSNLRMSATRQARLQKKNNIAWRPDNVSDASGLITASAAMRQLRLDPDQTEVDVYDPDKTPAPTGNPKESADDRNSSVSVNVQVRSNADSAMLRDDDLAIRPIVPVPNCKSPLLQSDPPTAKAGKTKERKARERGWGEIFFKSYHELLELCEDRLNTAFVGGKLEPWWKAIVGVDPKEWKASPKTPLKPLTEGELRKTVEGCLFPVHAMGYNWLQSNEDSGKKTAKRISDLIENYVKNGYQCERVILVTHSMGGLVARAVIHPEMGAIEHKILGVVHGVMPAIGAAAGYARMRCGFEDGALNVVPKILGNYGNELTAVLGNSPGGLELLPSQAYGNDWLQITRNGQVLKSLPQRQDPYEEIYKLRGKWYGLLREEWLNPANEEMPGIGFTRTSQYLDHAKEFHSRIASTYHEKQSYAHYGVDTEQRSWRRVFWEIDGNAIVPDFEKLQIVADTAKGTLSMQAPGANTPMLRSVSPNVIAKLLPPRDPGDTTVPQYSADAQLSSGKFKGVFQQTGYEHQDSYKNEAALLSTVYSLIRIAQTMTWAKNAAVKA